MEHACNLAGRDIGRDQIDGPFRLEAAPPLPWAHQATAFTVHGFGALTETVNHPHLALLKLMRDCDFRSVIDIGCGEGAEVRLLRHLGKDVTAVNFDPACGFVPDHFGDFMTYEPGRRFDAVWCSHVLEHVRNPGAFLDRIYDTLNGGGWLALSVPYHEFGGPLDAINIGHHNRYNTLLLAYQLVCAGFDCSGSDFSAIVHGGQISVVLRKVPNGMAKSNFAPYAGVAEFMPVGGNFQECPAAINWPLEPPAQAIAAE